MGEPFSSFSFVVLLRVASCWPSRVARCNVFFLSPLSIPQVKFKQSKIDFEHRFEKYLDPHFFHHRVRSREPSCHVLLGLQGKGRFFFFFFFFSSSLHLILVHPPPAVQIHWLSIFNSFMMVIFLVGLVTMILMRTLRKDFARYSKDDELDDIVRADAAWRMAWLFPGRRLPFRLPPPGLILLSETPAL